MFNFISNLYTNYKIYILIVAISGLLISAFFFGYRYAKNACEAEKLEAISDAIKAQEEIQRIYFDQSKQFEEFRTQAMAKQQDLQKRLKYEFKKDDAYSHVLPSGGVQLLSEAIATANAS